MNRREVVIGGLSAATAVALPTAALAESDSGFRWSDLRWIPCESVKVIDRGGGGALIKVSLTTELPFDMLCFTASKGECVYYEFDPSGQVEIGCGIVIHKDRAAALGL